MIIITYVELDILENWTPKDNKNDCVRMVWESNIYIVTACSKENQNRTVYFHSNTL